MKLTLRKPKFIPFRYRFIGMTGVMLIILLSSLAVLISFLQSRTIRYQLESRGVSIARSLSATSTADLLTYNYVALERSANQAARGPDIIAVIFHDKEGRVAGFSGRPDLQNTLLQDEISRNAIEAPRPLIQPILSDNGKNSGIDIAIPIFPEGADIRWGTIRVQLSLKSMYEQIRQIQLVILVVGLIALFFGTVVSLFTARRITKPLNTLMLGTQSAAAGNLDQDFRMNTGDEVEILAANFNIMIAEIVAHRSQLEQQLTEIKRLQKYTTQLLTTMSDGLLSITMAGEFSMVNPAALGLLQLHPKDAGGRSAADHLKCYPTLLAYIKESLAYPVNREPVELLLEKEGAVCNLLVSSSVLKDRTENPIEIILNLHDITELKKMEASVRQAERLAGLGTLAAGMAHEIRNPLSSVQTFVQLLPRKIEKEGFLEKFNRTVPRELKRINQLVEDLLDLARVPKYTFRPTSIENLLVQTLETLEEELRAGNIDSRCDFPAQVPLVRADVYQITKAFHNLIRNAIQAMPGGGNLVIRIQYDQPEHLVVLFQDTGEGIPDDELKNIFNPFYTTKIKGTGLGLSITHKVVSEHGGSISVSCPKEGGTIIMIQLPI
ncbi:MAG: ATP-binding protein [Desulfopila sp.]|jgi:two-component system sensor histidine kinase AtoS|nr:ATP-binding protein [Desulfopila sp.]